MHSPYSWRHEGRNTMRKKTGAPVGFVEASVLEPGLKEWLKVLESLFLDSLEWRQGGPPWWHGGKESTGQFRRCKRRGFNPWVRKIPWRRKWQPTPVFLPGKSHGQRKATVRGAAKSWTWLSDWAHTHDREGFRCLLTSPVQDFGASDSAGESGYVCVLFCTHCWLCALCVSWEADRGGEMEKVKGPWVQYSLVSCFP